MPPRGHDLDFLAALPLDDDQLSFAPADRDEYREDYGRSGGDPDAVVHPESTDDVSRVLAACDDRGVPVTPYAAGTGLEGGALAVAGGVALDTTRLDATLDVRPDDLVVEVSAGVVGADVTDAAAEHGLFFPPFPQSAAFSTVGGMVATDASGTRTVKYGEVGDWVLGLEAVRADGTVLTTGCRARKTSSGYNLTDLLVGSEGTLAVITRVTLELAVEPRERRAGRATFADLDDASAAIAAVVGAGVDVATIELLDPLTVEMVNAHAGTTLPDAPVVFLEFHGNEGIDAEVTRCREALERHGAGRVEMADEPADMDRLWDARRAVADAITAWDADRDPLAFGDVTVPIGSFPAMVRAVHEVGDDLGFDIPTFGHAGDGNVHYAILADLADEAAVERGRAANERIVRRALDLGGTATGEHGVGLGKRPYMREEHGEAGLRAMREIRTAFDPNGTLNPNKLLPGE
jgi:D-lactate dehydrogenase (cytochrome)